MPKKTLTLPKRAGFPTSPASPFADKFDLDAARQLVAHLFEMDPAQIDKDPAYPLFVEYEKRVRLLEQMRETHRIRFGANAEVPTREAEKLDRWAISNPRTRTPSCCTRATPCAC